MVSDQDTCLDNSVHFWKVSEMINPFLRDTDLE